MSIYQKVNQTKMVKKLFWINFPEGCLSLTCVEINVVHSVLQYNCPGHFISGTLYEVPHCISGGGGEVAVGLGVVGWGVVGWDGMGWLQPLVNI